MTGYFPRRNFTAKLDSVVTTGARGRLRRSTISTKRSYGGSFIRSLYQANKPWTVITYG